MDPRALRPRHLLAAVAVVAAALVLAVQLISPSPIVVSMSTDGTQTTRIGQYFTYGDVAVVGVSAALLGAAGTYLLVSDPRRSGTDAERADERVAAPGRGTGSDATALAADGAAPASAAEPASDEHATNGDPDQATATDTEPDREAWESAAERLTGNEETVFRLVLDAGGELPQREIVEETDLSKATVSRTLDALEHRDLLERKRRGMGNLVTLT